MGIYLKQLFGTDKFVILTEGKNHGHLTRLDDKGAFAREHAALFTSAPEMLKALKQVVSDCQLAIDALGNSPEQFDATKRAFGIVRDRAAAAVAASAQVTP